jgi:two-component system, NarL family, response regulator LiaR
MEQDQTAIRVMVLENHEILAEGLRRCIERSDDLKVVASLPGVEAIVNGATHTVPDVVLIDLDHAVSDDAGAVAAVREKFPEAHIVGIADSVDAYHRGVRAIKAGCDGVISQASTNEELLSVIRGAATGNVMVPSSLITRLMMQRERRADHAGNRLSSRELDVLDAMARGYTDREIADDLVVSLNTARKHVQNVIRKLGAHSKLEAVITAMRDGIIVPP